jgi:CelD/BcsL family acetyltransferase involved in cellulose biosynthesis
MSAAWTAPTAMAPTAAGSALRPRSASDFQGVAGFTAEFIKLEELGSVEPQWRNLFHASCEPNPFLGPDFLLPLVRRVARTGSAEAALVWRRDEGERRLAAFFPYRTPWQVPLLSTPAIVSFSHPFLANATPLLAADGTNGVAEILLDALAHRFPRHLLVLDRLRLDGPSFAALTSGAAALGRRTLLTQSFERAALRAGLSSEAYLIERIGGKKLRELRRCERRLGEAGRMVVRTLSGSDVANGLQEFLRLEASGWKGRRGTALACRSETHAFAREALAGASAPSVLIDVLTLDEVAIAAAVHLVAGSEAVAFKCAYDESWSRMSPGTVLDLHTLRLALDAGLFETMDSGAIPGHPVEALWRDRIRIGQLAMNLDETAPLAQLEAFARRQKRALGWKTEAKTLLGRLRRIRSELRATLNAADGAESP